MEGLVSSEGDPEPVLREAARVYERSIEGMRSLMAEMRESRADRRPIPARKIWQLGNAILTLRDGLAELSLQLDGVYRHLVRDLGVKTKWLEKVVIFRRYIPAHDAIPESLNWGRCEKGTRRIAERLSRGLPLA